jgi:uroporphyrinogen decarboxylase
VIGADGIKGGILQSCLWLRGYEQFFTDLAVNKEFALALIDKVLELFKAMYARYIREVGEFVQLVYITDDVGTQNSLLLSPRMFRKMIKPRFQEFIGHVKSLAPHVKVMYHTDGAVLPLIDDFIDMGADILNPIQTSTKGLDDTKTLKEQFGDRLSFHGAIDVQQVLPNASAEEVKQEVARRIRDLGTNGGYICAPCHNISFDIPPENVVALFEAAKEYGRYPLQ